MAARQETLESFQERVHETYGRWAPDHADGQAMTVAGYDPTDYYQWAEISRFQPRRDLRIAENLGRIGMGSAAFEYLQDRIKRTGLIETALARHYREKSSLVATLHLKDVFDTAMTHNGVFVASGGDEEVSEINDIVASPMMSRLKLGNMAVMRALTASGSVDMALPAAGALKHGMAPADIQRLERQYGPALKSRLAEGVLIHWALPGRRGEIKDENTIIIPLVDSGIANIVRKRAPWAVPVAMEVEFGGCKVEVLEPRDLPGIGSVHDMMEEMAEAAGKLTGKNIIYGSTGKK